MLTAAFSGSICSLHSPVRAVLQLLEADNHACEMGQGTA